MTTKIEEVARAIWDEDTQCDGLVTTSDWQDFKPIYVRVARAAIKAMREPSEAMVDDGVKAGEWDEEYNPAWRQPDFAKDVYRAMIDAALNEGKE